MIDASESRDPQLPAPTEEGSGGPTPAEEEAAEGRNGGIPPADAPRASEEKTVTEVTTTNGTATDGGPEASQESTEDVAPATQPPTTEAEPQAHPKEVNQADSTYETLVYLVPGEKPIRMKLLKPRP